MTPDTPQSARTDCHSERIGGYEAAGLVHIRWYVIGLHRYTCRACMAVAAPAVSSSRDLPNLALSGGVTATILGLNFGGYNLTPSAAVPAEVGQCDTASWTSKTTVSCITATVGRPFSDLVTVTISDIVGTTYLLFTSFDAPVVTSATPSNNRLLYSSSLNNLTSQAKHFT